MLYYYCRMGDEPERRRNLENEGARGGGNAPNGGAALEPRPDAWTEPGRHRRAVRRGFNFPKLNDQKNRAGLRVVEYTPGANNT